MATKVRSSAPGDRSRSRVLGERAFAAISAVEGLTLNPAAKKRMAAMKRSKLTAEEQRREIVKAYSKAGSRR